MIQSLTSAFFLGVLGSFHCVGMCGPLALALPLHELGTFRRVLAIAGYHGGRIAVYAFAGAFFGIFGRGVYLAGWQQEFSIVIGVLLVFFTLFSRFSFGGLAGLRPLQKVIMRLWHNPRPAKFVLLGMANGLLPCGMVYLAIAGALTRASIPESAAFMACFGAGTLPLLLLLQYTGLRIALPARAGLRRVIPFVTIVVGLLLILRGLDLGIPFLSPALPASPGRPVSCH